MKKLLLLTTACFSLGLLSVSAQFSSGSQSPQLDGAMGKLFGDNKTFSANMGVETSTGDSGAVSMSGKFSYDNEKSRFEMNLTDVHSSAMTAATAQQMKSMGMDRMIAITRPDLKVTYVVYPGLNSYAEMAARDTTPAAKPEDYKVETVSVGKETVDGHDCEKNKVTVTGKDNVKHEFTVWAAADLKKFPVKIETAEGGHTATITYKNVTLGKPSASDFETPSGYTKYTDMQTMMQTEMMKRVSGGAGVPAH